ncbi:MAG: GTPase HflX, partial [Rhizorhabdus sp.]|nr:GTPase HflX [Rhizorhabdus sp.]
MSVFNRDEDDGLSRGARALVALPERAGDNPRTAEARLDEAAGLAAAIGIDVVGRLAFRLRDPKPATLFGSGQVEQIALAIRQDEAELLVVDAAL